jgi:repressor LexA
VKLEWIGEICVTLPRGQIERLRAKAAARARRKLAGHGGHRDAKPHAK